MITNSSWVILCPPTEGVATQATVTVLGQPPEPFPSEEIGMYKINLYVHSIEFPTCCLVADNLDSLRSLVFCKQLVHTVATCGGIS